MNSPHYFEIQADDVDRAKQFYGAVFGWKFTAQQIPMGSFERIETEGIAGGLLQRPVPIPAGGAGTNAAVISMQVVSFDETAEAILAAGGIVALSKFPVPGRCWQGYFLDTEGNTFGIFEADEQAG